ncbi:PXDN [Mytilus edulis]|uniref:PXDN n=1 Tax=Mytilus edulis TaxID=6550 RepID=A0A8S3RXA7_MYTED|nr:PXDN [Mytilus edulis]
MDADGVRQQINLATPFVDASTVYGSTQEMNEILRVPYSYLLKTDNNLLPTPPGVNTCFDPVIPNRCPVAGDRRVSESPMLSVQHSVWLREHNRIATELHILNPHWNQETVFQEARKIIIAMLQQITYNDFLPTILGQTTMERFKLFSRDVNEGVFDDSYDPKVNPQILDSVNVAAHRYGHSQLTNNQNFVDEGCNTVTINYLKDTFESPRLVQQNNGANIPFLARHLACSASNKLDNFIADGMRNFLLRLPEAPGSDIVARTYREEGNKEYRDITHGGKYVASNLSNHSTNLESLGMHLRNYTRFKHYLFFSEPDDVDLFIGAMLEKDPGFNVGPTFQCLLGMQYQLIKSGDRFWYERPCEIFSFTEGKCDDFSQ